MILGNTRCMGLTILTVVLVVTIVHSQRVEILMPNVTTVMNDAYMCTSYKIGDDQSYIINIDPLTNMNVAHHMFAFGCDRPAVTLSAWNCESQVCLGEKSILFAWGRNAPKLDLPDDVAFRVGKNTKFRYIVVNIHYLNKISNDKSGLAMTFTNIPRPNLAGIMLMVTGGISIPPLTKKYTTDMSCKYEGRKLNVFAFRVHAHAHGDVNTAYRIRNHEWKLLAKGDPQWPQAFYKTNEPMDIVEGDILVGRCTYHNDDDHYVYAGATHADEMCNIYLMFYTDGETNIQDECGGTTYPQYEKLIPIEAEIRPPPIKMDDSKGQAPPQHHDMEANPHNSHQTQPVLVDNYPQTDGKNRRPSFLNSAQDRVRQQQRPEIKDDYYEDIERSRSKNRQLGGDMANQNPVFYDLDSIIDYDDLEYPRTGSLSSSLLLFNSKTKTDDLKALKTQGVQYILKPKTTISKYSIINDWFDKSKISIGQVGGIALDSGRGNLVVFHRGSTTWQMDSFDGGNRFNTRKYKTIPENTIIAVNSNTGQVVKSWGANLFYMPHGIRVDPLGNVWVTDVGRHQVLKFAYGNTDEPVLVIGENNVPGSDQSHFCKPTDVAVLQNGDFFVADGYCNSRIMKFDKNGKFKMQWSSDEHGSPGHFFIPHALALHEPSGLLCVADRENYRIQCFDLQGTFLHEATPKDFGPIYGVSFASNNGSILYVVNGQASSGEDYEKKIALIQITTGNVLGSINIDQDLASAPHDIEVNSDASEVYIGTLNPQNVLKYALLNYNIQLRKNNSSLNNKDESKKNPSTLKSSADNDTENFRTSMFIMAFLAIPLILIICVATCVRLKNMGKLGYIFKKRANIEDYGKWIRSTKKSKNGFTRLDQDSDNEAEPLDVSSDSDEVTVPNKV